MNIFKRRSHAEISRERSLRASRDRIIEGINMVSKNGHYSYTVSIKRDLGDSGISRDIVDRMKTELESKPYGYTVEVTNNEIKITW